MASGETGIFQCGSYGGATVDTQAGASELDSTIMASVETAVLEYDSFPSTAGDAHAGEIEDGMASTDTEAFEGNPCAVGPVDAQAVGSVHDNIIMGFDLDPHASVSVDTVDTQAVGDEQDNFIGGFGETESLNCGVYATASVGTVEFQAGGSRFDSVIVSVEREADPVTMASLESVDVQEDGSEHNGTVIVSTEREALECNPRITASVDSVDGQVGGNEQDVTMIASVETGDSECNPSATSAVDFKVSVDEDRVTSPRAQNIQLQATNLVSGDDQTSVTVLGSITHLETLVTSSMNTVSNQEGDLRSASPACRIEDVKVEQVIVQNVEVSQGEEPAYDIEIVAHEVSMTETFFNKHCMFPVLDADKSEAWQVAGDDVTMEDSSLKHDKGRQETADAKSISIETDSGVVVNHDVGEKVDTEERQAHTMPVQPSSEALPMDALRGLEGSSGLKPIMTSYVQGHMNIDGSQCGKVDIGNVQGLASGVDQDEKLLYNAPEDVCAQGINLLCDADDIFMSFPGEDMEIVHPAGSSDTRISEDKKDGIVEFENEDIHSYKLDQDLPGSSSDMGMENTNSGTVSNEEELQRKLQAGVVGARMEESESREEGVTQAEIQDKGAPSAIVIEKDECTDLESNEQSVEVGKDADVDNFSGAASANSSQSLNYLAGNLEPMYAPENEEQEENIVSSDSPIQVVSQALAQETAEPNQNVAHDEATLINEESEVVHEVSHMEADTLHKEQEQVEKQADDTLLTGGKSVDEVDGMVLHRRQSDGDLILKDRDAVAEDKVAEPEQENEVINRQQEELRLRQPVDTCPLQAEIGKDAVSQDLSRKSASHISRSSGPGTGVSSCTEFSLKNEISDGLNDVEKPAVQGLVLCEESTEKNHQVSLQDANAFSKKQFEKPIGDYKSPRVKGSKKLDRSITEAEEVGGEKSGKETDDDSSSSEYEEELSDKKLQKPQKEGNAFGIGDLVWAKVRSHPWWPAQIFDPADASKSARKAKKSGKVLVAFFGDCTFAWLQQSQMIAFRPNFKEKVKQTTMRIFCMAVEEALEEFCRRSELGLSCTHFKGSLHCTSSFPDANAGIREGVRVKRHKDILASVQMFRPAKTIEFVKGVACSPLGAWSSTLHLAELRGHAYGLRTCMVASGSLDTAPLLPNIYIVPSQGSKLKRSHSALKSEVAEGSDNEAKRLTSGKEKRASEGKGPSQISKKRKMGISEGDETVAQGGDVENKSIVRSSLDASEGNRDRLSIKFKVSKKIEHDRLLSFERLSDTEAGQVVRERSSDDGGETLLALAGKSAKVLKTFKEDRDTSSVKKKVRRQSVRESQHNADRPGVSDREAAAATRVEDGAFAVSSILADERLLNAKVIKGKGKKKLVNVTCSPVSSVDTAMQEGTQQKKRSSVSSIRSRDEINTGKLAKTSDEVNTKREVLGNDKDAGKKEAVRKFSKMGDSIRKVASELTGTPATKCADDSSIKSTGPSAKKKMKDLALEPPASPTPTTKKVASKKSTEDISLLQLRQDLELLANKSGSGGGSGRAAKKSKKVDQVAAVGTKSSPHWQNVPHRKQRSCVQELTLAARKRKSEISHDEVLAKLPKNSLTAGSERHHTSKAYITSAEKSVERRSFDKNLLHYSRRPAPPASNMKSSSQRYDEKLSSHMPLALFMRFPEDFPLPSESQLKATFIPFGPLQMSATRLYKDTASAQVVFKHGRDAESALKHAKKNAMFGQVAVTYRLRYLSHSSRMETKTDASSPNKAHLSLTTPGRKAYYSKEKAGGPSASSENRAGDKVADTSPSSWVQDATLSESEPTGDIQDQMMTLLRQVSVIVNPVNPSPVPSHDT